MSWPGAPGSAFWYLGSWGIPFRSSKFPRQKQAQDDVRFPGLGQIDSRLKNRPFPGRESVISPLRNYPFARLREFRGLRIVTLGVSRNAKCASLCSA
jgi:hypothetical protein